MSPRFIQRPVHVSTLIISAVVSVLIHFGGAAFGQFSLSSTPCSRRHETVGCDQRDFVQYLFRCSCSSGSTGGFFRFFNTLLVCVTTAKMSVVPADTWAARAVASGQLFVWFRFISSISRPSTQWCTTTCICQSVFHHHELPSPEAVGIIHRSSSSSIIVGEEPL